jgi:hypothetical protein
MLSKLLALSLLITSALAADPIELFNGQDLTGWVQKGGKAKFTVEDGAIVGTTVPNTENSFLCTEKEFTNFTLELEFQVDPGLNSGVQIRSRAADKPTTETWAGAERKFGAGRVHGLQVEIDPSGRAWTGGIQVEGGGDWRWLHDLKKNEPARKAFKAGEWNKLRIEAKGDTIKTWLNGVPAADLKNDVIPTGFIALQVHSIGKKTDVLHVRFRHLKLEPLP